ncbi:type II toxin-antitoxin system Phd/YefM family antitoxin [Mesorhizobium xinjiangense]|uniref:type II toxin-antitoxin system Phd/YefM family antitoxin n=1 Tax=Mesorhizobium xinjiangense TaxID=2678685 RepID=UPI0012ED8289|nr:type II toxin-antitoxin system prevent-host-death family antitoxin [Mesorhizobium xinjiangense]
MNEHPRSTAVTTVSVAEAKARFSQLLERAAAGEEIHVTKHGKPYAKFAPERADRPTLPRVGAFEGTEYWMSDDWDELGPEWGRASGRSRSRSRAAS